MLLASWAILRATPAEGFRVKVYALDHYEPIPDKSGDEDPYPAIALTCSLYRDAKAAPAWGA